MIPAYGTREGEQLGCVRVTLELFRQLFLDGNEIRARITNGLPPSAEFVHVRMSERLDVVEFFVKGVPPGDHDIEVTNLEAGS